MPGAPAGPFKWVVRLRPFARPACGPAGARVGLFGDASCEAVAAALDVDDFGAVQQAVKHGSGGGDVAEQFAPFVDGAVGGHDNGADFMVARDEPDALPPLTQPEKRTRSTRAMCGTVRAAKPTKTI